MSIKLGDSKSRTPISAYSTERLEQMMAAKNTPAKTKKKLKEYLEKQR